MSVIYGDTAFMLEGKYMKIPAKEKSKYIMPFCHQSVFVKTELLKQHHFDTSFKICADNDFFIKIKHLGYKFYKVDQIIAVYDVNGISAKNFFTLLGENFRIAQKYNNFYFILYVFKFCYLTLRHSLKSFIPSNLANKIKAKLYEKP